MEFIPLIFIFGIEMVEITIFYVFRKTDLEKFVADEETKMSECLQKIIDCHTKRLNAIKVIQIRLKYFDVFKVDRKSYNF